MPSSGTVTLGIRCTGRTTALAIRSRATSPPAATAQHVVGFHRPVSGYDVDIILAADLAIDLPDDVKQLGVHLGRLITPPVAQEMVDLLQGGRIELAVALVGENPTFAGMGEIEFQRPVLAPRIGASRSKQQRNQASRKQPACAAMPRHDTIQ